MAPPANGAVAPPPPPPPPPPDVEGEHGAGHHEHGKHEEHPTFHLSLDAVLGFGKSPFLVQGPATSNNVMPGFSVGESKVFVTSLLLGAEFEVVKNVHLGARWPISYANFSPENDNQSRGTSAAGNLEIEGAYHHHIDERSHLAAGLGIALPTAQGTALPEGESLSTLTATNPQLVQQNDYDRRGVNRAAAASRGWEDNALFTPHYLGFIPHVHYGIRIDQLHIDPFAKLEYLVRVAQKDTEANASIAELVFGARIGYQFVRELEGAVRVWGNVGIAGKEDGSLPSAAVIEPQLKGHFGNVMPVAGVIIPVAGKGLTDPRWTGIRLGVTLGF